MTCSVCGGTIRYYDKVDRIIKEEGGKKRKIKVSRYKCRNCKSVHRIMPDELYMYKHYSAEIIDGVIAGVITSDILEYEDFPCEMTMKRWMEL